MKISIEYCAAWNYLPRASSLEEDIKANLDIEIELIAGSGGIFTVSVDSEEIFSKLKQGRFPTPEEILAKLK